MSLVYRLHHYFSLSSWKSWLKTKEIAFLLVGHFWSLKSNSWGCRCYHDPFLWGQSFHLYIIFFLSMRLWPFGLLSVFTVVFWNTVAISYVEILNWMICAYIDSYDTHIFHFSWGSHSLICDIPSWRKYDQKTVLQAWWQKQTIQLEECSWL